MLPFVLDVWSTRYLERIQVRGGLVSSFLAVLRTADRQRKSCSEDRGTVGKLTPQPQRTLRIRDCTAGKRLTICCCGSWFEAERSRLSPISQPS